MQKKESVSNKISSAKILAKQKKEDELIEFVLAEFNRRQQERKTLEAQWLLNANFVIGNQYCAVDHSGDIADNEAQYFWQERECFNHIAPLYDSRLSKLSRVRPTMTVVPTSNDEKDVKSAKVSKNIIKATTHRLNVSEQIARATKWSELCGTVFYKIFWNSQIGQIVGTDEKNEPIYEGDVDLTICPPFEIYPDNSACEKLEDCRSIIHARAYHIDAIKTMFNVDVEGDTIDVFNLENIEKQGGLGFYTNVPKLLKSSKIDHALVIEYYELPNSNYVNGRLVIVAGDKLVYNGELPFINGDNKQKTFPFIRQCSMQHATNFWGASVIERLIPLQRAYNAVKNRKHEFMNRLSMGVLTVEDGSVDTGDLEEEGISPGKVLVYRQGSNPPVMMNYGSIPSEFTLEEERLYDEMVKISGVGDLNSNLSAFRNMSGVALQLLVEQDEIKMTMTSEEIRNAIRTLAIHTLRLYKQFANNKRVGRIIGSNATVELFYFNSSDLTSEDVIFETTNELNETTAQRRSMLLELFNNGLLHDENGKLNNRMRAKILELLGYGIWEQGQELVDLHRIKAQKENLMLLNENKLPEIETFDNHQIHIDEHITFLLSNHLDLTKTENLQKKQVLVEHIELHKQKLSLADGVLTKDAKINYNYEGE